MSNNSFYEWLPKWAYSSLQERSCSQCNKNYTKNDIVAIGLRTTEDNSYAMYVEHQCSKCKFRALTILGKQKEDTLEKLCYIILESIKTKKITHKSKLTHKHKKNNPMTDKEVRKFIKFMNSNQTHADFCKEIGIITFPKEEKDDSG